MIAGRIIRLRPANLHDRRSIYEWLAHSDVTALMLGPPEFPETPVPTWEEFTEDYTPFYFDGSEPQKGRCFIIEAEGQDRGQINYDLDGLPSGFAEFDIWMRSQACCGHGWGSDALETLAHWLNRSYQLHSFLIRPSFRNNHAVSAYQKAGFEIRDMTDEEQENLFGEGDYPDTAVMIKRMDSSGNR